MHLSLGYQSFSPRKVEVGRLGDRGRVLQQLLKNVTGWGNEGPVRGVRGLGGGRWLGLCS